jgi:hypothetical protein
MRVDLSSHHQPLRPQDLHEIVYPLRRDVEVVLCGLVARYVYLVHEEAQCVGPGEPKYDALSFSSTRSTQVVRSQRDQRRLYDDDASHGVFSQPFQMRVRIPPIS